VVVGTTPVGCPTSALLMGVMLWVHNVDPPGSALHADDAAASACSPIPITWPFMEAGEPPLREHSLHPLRGVGHRAHTVPVVP